MFWRPVFSSRPKYKVSRVILSSSQGRLERICSLFRSKRFRQIRNTFPDTLLLSPVLTKHSQDLRRTFHHCKLLYWPDLRRSTGPEKTPYGRNPSTPTAQPNRLIGKLPQASPLQSKPLSARPPLIPRCLPKTLSNGTLAVPRLLLEHLYARLQPDPRPLVKPISSRPPPAPRILPKTYLKDLRGPRNQCQKSYLPDFCRHRHPWQNPSNHRQTLHTRQPCHPVRFTPL